jgi:hypothetical protein
VVTLRTLGAQVLHEDSIQEKEIHEVIDENPRLFLREIMKVANVGLYSTSI